MSEYNLIVAPKDCDVLSLDDTGLLFEKQHAYPGVFRMKTAKGPVDFELTDADLALMATESQRYIDNGNQCNLPTKHTEDSEANRGHNVKWYTKTDSKGRLGLFSQTKFRDAEAAKLAKTAQTSLYCPPKFEDGAKNEYVRPIRHVALTDYPVIPGLDGFTPIAASLVIDSPEDKEVSMSIQTLAANVGLKLSDEVLADEKAVIEALELSFKEAQAVATELSDYKKLNPPKADPIRVSKAQINMMRENRELKLSQLVGVNILPCVKTKLEAIFCGDATLTLSLSEDVEDNFDEVLEALKENDSLKLSELTGPQIKDLARLQRDQGDEENPMMAVANKAAKAAGRN